MPDPEGGRWRRLEGLVDELLDLEPEARAGALRLASESDPQLAAEAERFLQAMESDDDPMLDTSAAASFPELVTAATKDAARDRAGDRLGPYRLISVLGRGGMGVVYLAERADQEFEKRVAIKLMPRGLENPEMERRFRLERQLLARLEHPGVARLLDGGVTDEGYPYLVMELVKGAPIDAWCGARELGLEERLRLFVDVCDGVQYAHQNLVVHRDIKPGNILVTEDGSAKLLDFGVAKLTEEDGTTTEATRFQPRTTAYASPEQIANRPVSTATDVYSLGAVLYRLLTGRTPREAAAGGPGVGEPADRAVDAPPASRAAARAVADGASVPWIRRLAGDLERILAKALAASPEERYSTVTALAEDIRRFLSGQTVTVREPTAGYRLRKFVARHRVGFFASTCAAVALAAALVVALWQADRAREEALRARRVSGLLSGLFTDADPWAVTSDEVTVLELVDRGVERVRDELMADPTIRLELLHLLGRAYRGLGHPESAIPVLEEVVADRRRRLGPRDPRTAAAMSSLGESLLAAGRRDEATPLIEDAVAFTEQAYGRDAPETADVLFNLGLLRKAASEYTAQETIFRRIVAIHRASGADPSAELALALGELSVALDYLGHDAEGLDLQREALEMAERTMGGDHPFAAALRNNMGLRLAEAGRHAEAAILLGQALEQLEGRPGVHETELVAPLSNLGRVLVAAGDFEGARPHVERAVEIAQRMSPPGDFARIGAEINLATLRRELGELDAAEAIYRDALARFEARLGSEHQATARARALLGSALLRAGSIDEAEAVLRSALAVQREPERDPMALDETLLALGRLLVDRGRSENLREAGPLLAESLSLREAVLPADHWLVAEVRLELALLAAADGRADPKLAAASSRVLAETLPAGDFRLARSRRLASAGR